MSDAVGDSYNEKQTVYVKTDGPAPWYLTAGKVYEVRDFDGIGFSLTDDVGHNWWCLLSQYAWTLCDAAGNPVGEQKEEWGAADLLPLLTELELAGAAWLRVESSTPSDEAGKCMKGQAFSRRRNARCAIAKKLRIYDDRLKASEAYRKVDQSENAALLQRAEVAESFHKVAVAERNHAWAEIETLRTEKVELCERLKAYAEWERKVSHKSAEMFLQNESLRAELAARGLVLSEDELTALEYAVLISRHTSAHAVLRNLLERAKR